VKIIVTKLLTRTLFSVLLFYVCIFPFVKQCHIKKPREIVVLYQVCSHIHHASSKPRLGSRSTDSR